MTRAIVLVTLFAFLAAASAQSLCDKYATALQVNSSVLIGQVVDGTISSVVSNTVTKKYFDGSLGVQWPGATNYTSPTNAVALARLRTLLVQFFGLALNCTDGAIGAYTGRSMYQAHIAMPIGPVQFESFNRQVLGVAAIGGVSAADQLAILATMNTLKPAICNQPTCQVNGFVPMSICDRYSAALNLTNWDLIDTVVMGVIANVTTVGSPLKKYFDGTIPGTTNFLTNPAALLNLRNHLDEFFGLPNVLNCSYVNFPAYQGRSLAASHANLQIDGAAFNLFNTVLLNIMASAGVSTGDLAAVNSVLVSTRGAIVTVGGNSTTTTTGASTGSASSTTTGSAAGSGTGSGSGTSSTSAASSVFMSAIAFFLVFAVYLF